MVARPSLHCSLYSQNCTSARVWRCHVTHDQHPRTNCTTEFPLYFSPRPITFFPGTAVTVTARLLSVGLACQYVVDSPAWLFSRGSYPPTPHINQTLPQIIPILHFCLVDSLLNYAQDFVVNWFDAKAVWRPQIWKFTGMAMISWIIALSE